MKIPSRELFKRLHDDCTQMSVNDLPAIDVKRAKMDDHSRTEEETSANRHVIPPHLMKLKAKYSRNFRKEDEEKEL